MDRIDLSEVCQHYRARVIHVTPLDDFYLLETNRGPKELRIWPRADVMRWSFAWRERLARQGFRELERFIRTRESKPYLIAGNRGFTMTDHQRHIEACQPGEDLARQCGRVIGMMHQAQMESPLLTGAEYLQQEQMKAESEWMRAKAMFEPYRSKYKREKGERRWVADLMSPLLQRLERSATMLTHESISPEAVHVSHRDLMRDNWGIVNGKLYLRGFFRPGLSVQQRDVAGYLRDMYMTHGDMKQVDAFLDGYEAAKPLRYGDYTLMLAFMTRPRELWRSVESYVARASGNQEASMGRIEQALREQEAVDLLLRHIADRAERTRGGAVDEPL